MLEENEITMCECCSEQRKKDFQDNFNPKDLNIGDFVKMGFDTNFDKIKKEHMWVRITQIYEDSIIGQLDNNPIICNDVKYGDIVKVNLKEISQHIRK